MASSVPARGVAASWSTARTKSRVRDEAESRAANTIRLPSGESANGVSKLRIKDTRWAAMVAMVKRTTRGATGLPRRNTPPAATPTASRATPAAASAQRFAGRRDATLPAADDTPPCPNPGFASASAKAAALANRSAGNFSSAFATAAATFPGTVFRCAVSSFGDSVITLATIACALGPVNGGSPISIS